MKTLNSKYNIFLYYLTITTGGFVCSLVEQMVARVHGPGWKHPSSPKCLMMPQAEPMMAEPRPKDPPFREANGFTSSRRTTCCRIWKAPACPPWLDWAQGGALNGRGSQGGASRSTLWSPVTEKELLTARERKSRVCFRGTARLRWGNCPCDEHAERRRR